MADPPTELTGDALADSLATLAEVEPLVQSLTNTVTIRDVANLVRHWNALPVMADTPGDAGEMAQAADSLLLNIGQVPERRVEAMLEAGQVGNDRGIPVVLDPVGLGSTPTREATAERLLEALECTVIKGNYGEISALAGVDAEVRGVESVGEYDAIADAAVSVADATGAVVVASGVTDVIATSEGAVRLEAGHKRLGEVVGTGCMLGATIATFAGALEDGYTAALHGTLAFGLAGELAAGRDHDGPASFFVAFNDTVAGLSAAAVADPPLENRLEPVEH